MKTKILVDSFEAVMERSVARAKRVQNGERIEPQRTIIFETPGALMKALSAKRLEVLQMAQTGDFSISGLADKLGRDTTAVRRDVIILRRSGLVRTVSRANPGHGQVTIVRPVAKRFELRAVL